MNNWKLLEAEIVSVLREAGYSLTENTDSGDKLLIVTADMPIDTTFNITDLARALSERVEVKSNAVRVTI